MALSLACPNCGKKYRAPDHLAGHRVKCRGCGMAFALVEPAADPAAETPVPATSSSAAAGPATMAPARSAVAPASGPGHSAAAARATGTPTPAFAPAASPFTSNADAVFATAFTGTQPRRRPNMPIPYPGSRQIDHWLPRVLPGLSLLWVALQAFADNQSGAGWAPIVRVMLLLVAFFVIVFPIAWLAINMAAAQARFMLPPDAKLRTAASFALPMAITASLYLSLGSFSAAIPGLIMGIAVAMGAVWLLMRIEPREVATALGSAAAAFTVSILICAGLLLAANAVVRKTVTSQAQFAESPLGPGLPWATSPVKDPKPPRAKDTPADPPAAPPGSENPVPAVAATSPAPEQVAVAPPVTPLVPVPSVEKPFTPPKPAPKVDPFEGNKVFGQQLPSTPKPSMPAEEDPDPAALPVSPAADPPRPGTPAALPADYTAAGGDPIAFALLNARSPMVASVRKTPQIGSFERFVPTLTPSNIALVVKRGDRADVDLLEAWDLSALKKVGSASVKRDVATNIAAINDIPSYCCSPDGLAWVRITSFPTLSLEVTSLSGASPPVRMPLKDVAGEVSVVGFAAADRVLIRIRNSETERIEVWDIKARSRAAQLNLPPHASAGANGVLSPDGKLFAVIGDATAKGVTRPQLSLLDVGGRGVPRAVSLDGIDPQRAGHPTGMSFSANGKLLGILYEQSGNTILLSYRMPEMKRLEPMAAPAGRVTPGEYEAIGDRLSSVADSRAWLVGGNVLLDAESGKVWGELGLELVCTHPPLGTPAGDAVIVAGDAGQRRVTLVRLKPPAKP